MNKIYLTNWIFHKVQKVNPKQKPKPPETFIIKGVLVGSDNEEELKGSDFYIRRALRVLDIKSGFENYRAVRIEFLREIKGIAANDGIGKNTI